MSQKARGPLLTCCRSLSTIDQINTNFRDSAYDSPTTPTGSDNVAAQRYANRKSLDSIKSLPLPGSRESGGYGSIPSPTDSFSISSSSRQAATDGRSSSSTGRHTSSRLGANPPSSFAIGTTPRTSLRSLTGSLNRSNSSTRVATLRSMPHVYPALLSQVANAFKQLLILSELVKEGISYKDVFDGRSAVSIIADIIKTPDRNLALLLGRALDAQKFFHDVTYDHRLRDNPNEIYRFRERLAAPFMSEGNINDSPSSEHAPLHRNGSSAGMIRPPPPSRYMSSSSIQTSESNTSLFTTPTTSTTNLTNPSTSPKMRLTTGNSVPSNLNTLMDDDADADDDMPTGVFTLLTDCYSPTCSRESLCYSINCPRRLEQMKRLNMKPQPGLTRKISEESLHDIKVGFGLHYSR